MKRTTITLTDELAELVAREADRRRMTVSELMRNLIGESLIGTAENPRDIPWAGLINEPAMVRAEKVDEALSKNWADDIDRDRG
jgi:Arc/MetJ family transcription regulator